MHDVTDLALDSCGTLRVFCSPGLYSLLLEATHDLSYSIRSLCGAFFCSTEDVVVLAQTFHAGGKDRRYRIYIAFEPGKLIMRCEPYSVGKKRWRPVTRRR